METGLLPVWPGASSACKERDEKNSRVAVVLETMIRRVLQNKEELGGRGGLGETNFGREG